MGHVAVHRASSRSGVISCTLLRRVLRSMGCMILLLSVVSVTAVQAQDCNCPQVCVTCTGTINALTVRYDGPAALVTLSEVNGQLYSEYVDPGGLITVTGTLPGGRFRGNTLEFAIDGNIVYSTSTNCAAGLFVNKVLANSFTIVSGFSLGGALCCEGGPFIDTAPPELLEPLPNTISANITEGCTTPVTWLPPKFNDCNPVVVTKSHSPGDNFAAGETLVTYEAKDSKGNSASWSFTVNVKDNLPPVIENCPADISVEASSDGGVVNWEEPTASDNCSVLSFVSSHSPGSSFPAGTTRVTYTATDNSGNSAICEFDVTVTILPVTPNEEEPEIKILTPIITANGDGINDKLLVSHIDSYPDNQVTIVDRWGNEVFRASGYDNESVVWSGRGAKGEALPTGTYFYVIRIITGAKPVLQKGFIELIE